MTLSSEREAAIVMSLSVYLLCLTANIFLEPNFPPVLPVAWLGPSLAASQYVMYF